MKFNLNPRYIHGDKTSKLYAFGFIMNFKAELPPTQLTIIIGHAGFVKEAKVLAEYVVRGAYPNVEYKLI